MSTSCFSETDTIDLGVSRLWPGEKLGKSTGDDRDPRWGKHTFSFHTESHTIDSFMDLVSNGISFSPTMKRSHRAKKLRNKNPIN